MSSVSVASSASQSAQGEDLSSFSVAPGQRSKYEYVLLERFKDICESVPKLQRVDRENLQFFASGGSDPSSEEKSDLQQFNVLESTRFKRETNFQESLRDSIYQGLSAIMHDRSFAKMRKTTEYQNLLKSIPEEVCKKLANYIQQIGDDDRLRWKPFMREVRQYSDKDLELLRTFPDLEGYF